MEFFYYEIPLKFIFNISLSSSLDYQLILLTFIFFVGMKCATDYLIDQPVTSKVIVSFMILLVALIPQIRSTTLICMNVRFYLFCFIFLYLYIFEPLITLYIQFVYKSRPINYIYGLLSKYMSMQKCFL